jgi:hypothetical protein
MTVNDSTQDAKLLKNGDIVATGSATGAEATGWEGRMTVPGRFVYSGRDHFALRLPNGAEVAVFVCVSVQTTRGRPTISHVAFSSLTVPLC